MIVYQSTVLALLLFFLLSVVRNLRDYSRTGAVPSIPENPGDLYILIPARNEAENIADCLRGIQAQTFRGFHLLVLDDDSDDDTAAIVADLARGDSRVDLLLGRPIPPGWAGKVWACSQLAEQALDRGAEWLLFLDADTRAQPQLVAGLLDHAIATRAGMVSTFPYQITDSFWERVTLPMLHFLITTFLPIRMVWESDFPGLVAACGQVELFSAEGYRRSGGHAAIPASFHDGLQLARRVKASGLPVRLVDASAHISCRMYAGGRAVWSGFTRNAYEGLGSVGALLVMTGLQVVLFLLPFLFLLVGLGSAARSGHAPLWLALSGAQIAVILLIRALQARRFGHPEAVLLHPLSVAALVTIQWASFFAAKRSAPIAWKGRAYKTGVP